MSLLKFLEGLCCVTLALQTDHGPHGPSLQSCKRNKARVKVVKVDGERQGGNDFVIKVIKFQDLFKASDIFRF